jgi:lysozyme
MTLKKGIKNPAAVMLLQNQLLALGYTITPDGDFGKQTEKVVRIFQKEYSLTVDGEVGPQTQRVIDAFLHRVFGIDVSHHKGAIDWNLIDFNYVKFVICKLTEGGTSIDKSYAGHIAALRQLNCIRGAYHYFRFTTSTVDNQIKNLAAQGIDFSESGMLPLIVDVEYQGKADANATDRKIQLSPKKYVDRLRDFLIKAETLTGKQPIIYTNLHYWNEVLGSPNGFGAYKLWLAAYTNKEPTRLPFGWEEYWMWQYSEKGAVTNIKSMVDKNVLKTNLADLQSLAGIVL